MILDYNRKPDATVDEKVQSLMESTQLALNDIARAQDTADVAKEDAQTSIALSQTARQAAARAKEAADEAAEAVEEIEGDVSGLKTRVTQAEADITAVEGNITSLTGRVADAEAEVEDVMKGLALAEDVIGTVNWIAQHGIYVASTDTTVVPGKIYYTLTGVAIASPTGNPSRNGYYELVSGKYVLSTDTTVDSLKTYYQVTAAQVAEPSGNPSTIPYYELHIDEAITQYINTHLTLTDSGLRVTDGSQSSMLISSDGVTIYGSTGQIVGQYGEGAIIGNTLGYHIEITGNRLSFKNVNTEIAYMTNDELYIPRVVVVDSMQIGNWIWDAISSENHLTLKWRG